MTAKVAIGTADPDLAAAMMAQLMELPDIEVVGVERGSAEVLAVVDAQQDLNVVLIAEDIGPLPSRELIREISMRRPHCAAVLVTAHVDEEVLTRALETGARGVLPRRASLEELQSRISAAADWSQGIMLRLRHHDQTSVGDKHGRVVALAGAKGGTGTTMLAIQLAFLAADRGVCLVDLDLQAGDLPSYLDLVHRRSIADLVDVAGELTGPLLSGAVFQHEQGPHVLLAPAEGERAEEVGGLAVRQILGSLRSRYDVVLLDCGSFMTEGSVTAVEFADQVVLTVTPDLPALRAAKRTVEMWARLEARKSDDVLAVLVRQSRRSEIQPDFAARVLGLKVAAATIPPVFRALDRAVNNGHLAQVDDDGYRQAVRRLGLEIGVLREAERSAQRGLRRRLEGR